VAGNPYANDFDIRWRSCARTIMKIVNIYKKSYGEKSVAPFLFGHGVNIL